MGSCRLDNLSIAIDKKGVGHHTKASQLMRVGRYSEIRTPAFEFHFNLNGEIKFIRGLDAEWPHPAVQFKRTDGNDWVFYSVGNHGGDKGVLHYLGEYYLPCLPYPSNSLWDLNPFADPNIVKALGAWSQLYGDLYMGRDKPAPAPVKEFVELVLSNDENVLHEKSQCLQQIIGVRPSVLPPDSRHVDYEVIPLMVADGCLYDCDFCQVKAQSRFQTRSRENIVEQIQQLKRFYGRNLQNYHALFLGSHDALAAGEELVTLAATAAAEAFDLRPSSGARPRMFLFGSVDSLLKAGKGLLERMDGLPFYTYINIGFESFDQGTLAAIGKPLETSRLLDAFQMMLGVNGEYKNLEITANFLLGQDLPTEHEQTLVAWLKNIQVANDRKGAVYLSPLMGSRDKEVLLDQFERIKKASQLPVYLYLIQRL